MKPQTAARKDPDPPVSTLTRKRMARGELDVRPPDLPQIERPEPPGGQAPGTGEEPRGASDLSPRRGEDESAETERPIERLVAERAYFIYLARDGREGDALGDWLEAERQIAEERA